MLSEVFLEERCSRRFRSEANGYMGDLIHWINNSGTHAINRGDVVETLKGIHNESYIEAGYVTAKFSPKAIGTLQNIMCLQINN
ncbi:hypothetical protein Lwal_2860 [Legionella waltersii]|uniref:Uncharacterized protein n=1 Tax=Legionella waltersii TaxID=66969 RepID=A0A0W1A1A1_9GAMM|nr:hypothetical protein Lwal_2860 [Legionella waltersii]SNV11600.1 Uncharacterised protein [Legionella waltersii]